MLRVQSALPSLTERKTEAQICQKQLVTCLAASDWHSQVLNPWMAGLLFFSNIKLPYTCCILAGQTIQSLQDKTIYAIILTQLASSFSMTNKPSMQSEGDLLMLMTEPLVG